MDLEVESVCQHLPQGHILGGRGGGAGSRQTAACLGKGGFNGISAAAFCHLPAAVLVVV